MQVLERARRVRQGLRPAGGVGAARCLAQAAAGLLRLGVGPFGGPLAGGGAGGGRLLGRGGGLGGGSRGLGLGTLLRRAAVRLQGLDRGLQARALLRIDLRPAQGDPRLLFPAARRLPLAGAAFGRLGGFPGAILRGGGSGAGLPPPGLQFPHVLLQPRGLGQAQPPLLERPLAFLAVPARRLAAPPGAFGLLGGAAGGLRGRGGAGAGVLQGAAGLGGVLEQGA